MVRKLLFKIRNTRLMGTAYRNLRTLAQGPGWGGFHRDAIYRAHILDLLQAFNFSSFVETGTYHGYSTELVASRFPNLPVFTSEVVQSTHDAARRFLRKYPNISQELASSDEWVARLLKSGKAGPMPLFYLDAHWEQYWPLRSELRHISDAAIKTIIVIDDFEVPGRDDFGFDVDGGGELRGGEKCNLDYILPSLGAQNQYHAIFPSYTRVDAFGAKPGILRGHIVLFQNAPQEYDVAVQRPLFQKHYRGQGRVGATA